MRAKIRRSGNQTLVMPQRALIPLPNHVLPPHSYLTWCYFRKHSKTLSRETNNNQTVDSIHLQKLQTRSFEGQRLRILFFLNRCISPGLLSVKFGRPTAEEMKQHHIFVLQLFTTHVWKKVSRLRLYCLSEEVSTVNNALFQE